MKEKIITEVVIDAGSSGTRIFLYEVLPGNYPIVNLISEQEYSITPSGKKEDGLNNYVNPKNPELAQEACNEVLKPLLESVRKTLKEKGIECSSVIVNLFATAGMRYTENHFGSTIVNHFYEQLRNFIEDSGFRAGEIRTCNGNHEEGLWTWINLNDTHRDIFRSSNEPLGVVEVGGSSSQLSFPVSDALPDDDITHDVLINGKKFTVYCKTFLGLGQDDARKKMRTKLGPIDSSVCFPSGFPHEKDHGDVLDGVGELKLKQDGGYNYENCWNCYDSILSELSLSDPFPDINHIQFEFVGIDGVYHALKYWNIENNPTALTETVKDKIGNCDEFEDILNNEFVQAQTANATYISALLHGPNGLFSHNPKKIIGALPNKTNKGRLLTWTRGFLLVKYALPN